MIRMISSQILVVVEVISLISNYKSVIIIRSRFNL